MDVDPRPFAPLLRGVVRTTRRARRFERDLRVHAGATWACPDAVWPKFAGRELTPLIGWRL